MKTPRQAPEPSSATWTLHVAGTGQRLVRGGQPEIDECNAVVYYGTYPDEKPATPTLWIAGHDYCGYDIWREAAIGSVVTLRSSSGTEHRYRLNSRVFVPRQGGTSRGLVHSDLMLQTCKGDGTTITYATRLAP